MATLSFDIPDAQVPRLVDLLCTPAGLAPTNANARLMIRNHIKAIVQAEETRRATDAAAAAITPVDLT